MKKIQMNSPCCGAKIHNYGNRRRQCRACKKTWRMYKKKVGRKKLRVTTNIVEDVLVRGETITQRSRRGKLSQRQYKLRYHRALERHTKQWFPEIPNSELILLVDGLWVLSEKRKRHIVYLMAVRPINGEKAILLPPILLPGGEIGRKWEMVLGTIPQEVSSRIVALVCDGITGLQNSSRRRNWIVQRCNFHCIKVIRKFRGRVNSTIKNKELREDLYQSIRQAMVVPYGENYDMIISHIKELLSNANCPKCFRGYGNDFLRHREEFRSYIRHPQYNLPFTNSAMENLCGSARNLLRRSRGFKTKKSLEDWISVFIKMKKEITCNGKNPPS